MQRNLAGRLPTLSFASPIRPRKAGADDIEHPDQPPYGSAGDLSAQPPCGSTGEFILPPDQPPYGSVGDLPAQLHTVAQASSFFPLTSPYGCAGDLPAQPRLHRTQTQTLYQIIPGASDSLDPSRRAIDTIFHCSDALARHPTQRSRHQNGHRALRPVRFQGTQSKCIRNHRRPYPGPSPIETKIYRHCFEPLSYDR